MLLEIKKAPGANRKINDDAIAALKRELETGKGFSCYGAIVEWLKQEHDLIALNVDADYTRVSCHC